MKTRAKVGRTRAPKGGLDSERSECVRLRMTRRQAEVLHTLLFYAVGGSPYGPRGDTDAIYYALRDADIAILDTIIFRSHGNGLALSSRA